MKDSFQLFSAFILSALLTAACSEAPKEDKDKIGGLYLEHSDGLPEEIEGPQYQTPTIDILRGKAPLFPAKYPIKRYPGSKVAMVDVRAGRPPGWMNMVMLSTSDRMPNISAYYQQQLVTENWKKIYEYKNSIYESSKWVKGDIECEVRISPDLVSKTDKKNVQLFYGLRRKPNPIKEQEQ